MENAELVSKMIGIKVFKLISKGYTFIKIENKIETLLEELLK